MKKKRTKNEMVRATIDCLHELKTQIENDPFVQTSPIVETFNLNGAIVDQLKTLRIIGQTENSGKFWIGNNPDLNMVHAIKRLQRNYRHEYQNRKNGSNFVRIIRNGLKFGKSKPKQIQSKINFFDEQTNDLKSIKIDSDLMQQWKKSLENQKPIITDIPIVNKFDESMVSEFINHDPIIKKNNRQNIKKPNERVFELRLFGLKLFSIKY